MTTEAELVSDRQSLPEIDTTKNPVLFFDGVCGLCSWAVDFIMKWDAAGLFRFAPLQGETAQRLLPSSDVDDLSSMVLITDQGPFRRSAAAVRILWRLGPFWRLCGWLLWLIPRPIRDVGYQLVASLRYRLFGKKETCRLPTPQERERFLP
jgi:predicted DCC family thiol-disulfide oxidoreductase YuxK